MTEQKKTDNFNKNRLVSRLFQVSVALWFLRMVLPGVKYLFIPSLVLLSIATIWALKGDLFKKEYIFEFLKTFNPLFYLVVFYIIGIFLSHQLYSKTLYDLFELSVNFLFLIIFFALTYYSKSDEGFFWVFKRMSRVLWVTSVFVALIGLSKFLLQYLNIELPIETPWGTAINTDKNFHSLFSFIGLIGLFPRLTSSKSLKLAVLSNALVIVLILNIFFSYSPRSILLLVLFSLVLLSLQTLTFFNKLHNGFVRRIKKLRFISAFMLFAMFFVFFLIKKEKVDVEKVYSYYFSPSTEILAEASPFDIQHTIQLRKWEYAIEYFKSQSLQEKLFGSGFDYLKDFGLKFNKSENQLDYPHNPLLSALLYSGLIGAVFLLFFLFVAFYYALIYIKKHPLYSSMLIVCSMFVFFSGNSIFSVPVFLFLFSLSFLIRHQEITDLNIDANLDKPGSKFLKESFDYIASVLGFLFISPLLVVIGVFVLFSSGWPVVFSQTRIGQNGKKFRVHKFRTMRKVLSETTVAAVENQRITRVGRVLRKTKLDELPELWNIIRGDMSFVGTRPDVPGYADKLVGDDRIILKLKPGITGPASIKYINEEELLGRQENPQEYNDKVVWPDKVRINKEYYRNWSFFLDIKIIVYTLLGKQLK